MADTKGIIFNKEFDELFVDKKIEVSEKTIIALEKRITALEMIVQEQQTLNNKQITTNESVAKLFKQISDYVSRCDT